MFSIAIVGGGAAGMMSLLRGALNNDTCLYFTGDKNTRRKSREFWVSKVENMPGHYQYKKGISEPNKDTLLWLQESDFAQNISHQKSSIVSITKNSDESFHLIDTDQKEFDAKYVIICTGLMDIQPIINDSIKPILPYANMQTVDYCLRCDGHHTFKKNTGVIGHTDGAAWVASMLYERYEHPSMTIFTNGEKPEFSKEVMELVNLHKIQIKTSVIKNIVGENRGKTLTAFELEDGEVVPVEFSFVSLGMIVYNELAVSLGAEVDKRGFVIGDDKGQTNISGLYVAGDLRANKKKQIYTAWDMAVDSVDHINMRIRQEKREKLK